MSSETINLGNSEQIVQPRLFGQEIEKEKKCRLSIAKTHYSDDTVLKGFIENGTEIYIIYNVLTKNATGRVNTIEIDSTEARSYYENYINIARFQEYRKKHYNIILTN